MPRLSWPAAHKTCSAVQRIRFGTAGILLTTVSGAHIGLGAQERSQVAGLVDRNKDHAALPMRRTGDHSRLQALGPGSHSVRLARPPMAAEMVLSSSPLLDAGRHEFSAQRNA